MRNVRSALLATCLLFPGAGFAGDVSALHIIGFTPDGGVFAFEDYGVQDGSGFPYASRFYINTATDDFLPGTPIRVRIDDESAELATARAQARSQGDAIVAEATLSANPGFTAGFNAITEYSADPYRMVVNPRPVFPPADKRVEFRLEEIPMVAPADCQGIDDIAGFRLVRVDAEPGGQTTLIHEDGSVPASRNCPQGYRIGAVQTFHPESGDPVFAVMIAIRSMGFEGPNYRWIAVTGKL
jgi:predicted secreted protein